MSALCLSLSGVAHAERGVACNPEKFASGKFTGKIIQAAILTSDEKEQIVSLQLSSLNTSDTICVTFSKEDLAVGLNMMTSIGHTAIVEKSSNSSNKVNFAIIK